MSEASVVAVLTPGAIFHQRYEVVRCLKSGGMGAIYEVIHLDTRRRRALKTMLPELVKDKDLRERFEREATVAAEIESEHIVETFDAGFDAETGMPYLVMELLKGEDLGAMIERRKRLPATEVVALLYQAALALNKTHAAGVVHRDLKPENLFVIRRDDGSPRLKLLDFGIARLFAHGPIAKTTRLVGSPLYMSPEQIKGDGKIGPPSDLYSLGQIAYTLLVGEAYWEKESRATEAVYPLLLKIMLGAPEPATARAKDHVELPSAFDAWFTRATAGESDARFGTASALVDALADALDIARPRGTLSEEAESEKESSTSRDAPVLAAPTAPAVKVEDKPEALRPRAAPAPNTITDSTVGVRPDGASRRRLPIFVGAGFLALGVVVTLATWHSPEARRNEDPASTSPARGMTASSVSSAPAPPATVFPESNPWVSVEPPKSAVLLGVADEDAPSQILGFRPSRGVFAPKTPYQLQQHEVTWEEIEAWAVQQHGREFERPGWVPSSAADRAKLPVTGVPWIVARAYCKDLGGSLPTEEQWEFAARGADRRPNAWGAERLDLVRVRAFAPPAQSGAADSLPVVPVMTMDQDQTPGDSSQVLYDMAGNAMEWTADLYRESAPNVDEAWTEEGGVSYRAVRGLPLDLPTPKRLPGETAAWRVAVCATGPCPASSTRLLPFIGFRCAKGTERRVAAAEPAALATAPTSTAAPKAHRGAAAASPATPTKGPSAAEPQSKAPVADARQTGGTIGAEDYVAPDHPSPGALSTALAAATAQARACVAGADFATFATVKFASNGSVTGVSVTGWANANGKSACIQSAFQRARVSPFTQSSYSTRVTVRP